MKTILIAVMALIGLTAVAQTNSVPVSPAGAGYTTTTQFWQMAIAAVTPLIITGIRKVIPKIPTMLLPSITPLVGIGLGLAINALSAANLGWVDMAAAGALAVFVREVVNQTLVKQLEPKPTTGA